MLATYALKRKAYFTIYLQDYKYTQHNHQQIQNRKTILVITCPTSLKTRLQMSMVSKSLHHTLGNMPYEAHNAHRVKYRFVFEVNI